MHRKEYCALIVTSRRANRVLTYNSLRKQGYTGEIYLVLQEDEEQMEQYKALYDGQIVTYDKYYMNKVIDRGDNFDEMRAVVHARNATFDIAEKLGYKYFIMLDDDYTRFEYRRGADFDPLLTAKRIYDLDSIFDIFLEFYKNAPFLALAMAQGGDFSGGSKGQCFKYPAYRKCMNSIICSTERRFNFFGMLDEDACTFTTLGHRGELFFTVHNVSLMQLKSSKYPGGLTEFYKSVNPYVKSFYPILYAPSCNSITVLRDNNQGIRRLHRITNWTNACPAIVNEDYRKLS